MWTQTNKTKVIVQIYAYKRMFGWFWAEQVRILKVKLDIYEFEPNNYNEMLNKINKGTVYSIHTPIYKTCVDVVLRM